MNPHRPDPLLLQDCTGLIRQFVSCACGKYRRTKHRGISCDCCHTVVDRRNYDFMYFLREWLHGLRLRISALLKFTHRP